MRALKSSTRRKIDECGIGRCLTLSGFGSMPWSFVRMHPPPNEAFPWPFALKRMSCINAGPLSYMAKASIAFDGRNNCCRGLLSPHPGRGPAAPYQPPGTSAFRTLPQKKKTLYVVRRCMASY